MASLNIVVESFMITSFQDQFRFLSNFAPIQVEFNGLTFNSTEAAYQAAKCKNKEDQKKFQNIEAGKAKRLGKKVEIREDWNDVKIQIMEDLLRQKFSNPEYKNKLLLTGNQEIQEGNNWGDTFWGICNGNGENHLGKLLMKIRDEFSLMQEC